MIDTCLFAVVVSIILGISFIQLARIIYSFTIINRIVYITIYKINH